MSTVCVVTHPFQREAMQSSDLSGSYEYFDSPMCVCVCVCLCTDVFVCECGQPDVDLSLFSVCLGNTKLPAVENIVLKYYW